jgi:RNA polymerase sigma-70 factor (ECF subfamily)
MEADDPLVDPELIARTLQGDLSAFEKLVSKYQPKIFGTARRYARKESEVEDIVQEVFIKAFQKLSSFRGEAPFEHWLMRLTVRTCYDYLRQHQRNRETPFTDFTEAEEDWLDRWPAEAGGSEEAADAARQLVNRILEQLSPPARLIITLLEIEEKSVKEIAELTGWSVPLVKVRAFRARAEMKKCLEKIAREKYL